MQRYLYAIDGDGIIPFSLLHADFAEPQPEEGSGLPMAEVMPAANPGMIAMGMGDDGPVNRVPGINVKSALGAEQSPFGELYELHVNDIEKCMPVSQLGKKIALAFVRGNSRF